MGYLRGHFSVVYKQNRNKHLSSLPAKFLNKTVPLPQSILKRMKIYFFQIFMVSFIPLNFA